MKYINCGFDIRKCEVDPLSCGHELTRPCGYDAMKWVWLVATVQHFISDCLRSGKGMSFSSFFFGNWRSTMVYRSYVASAGVELVEDMTFRRDLYSIVSMIAQSSRVRMCCWLIWHRHQYLPLPMAFIGVAVRSLCHKGCAISWFAHDASTCKPACETDSQWQRCNQSIKEM